MLNGTFYRSYWEWRCSIQQQTRFISYNIHVQYWKYPNRWQTETQMSFFVEMAINGDTKDMLNFNNEITICVSTFSLSISLCGVAFKRSPSWKHNHETNVYRLLKISTRLNRYPFANVKFNGLFRFSYTKICIVLSSSHDSIPSLIHQ